REERGDGGGVAGRVPLEVAADEAVGRGPRSQSRTSTTASRLPPTGGAGRTEVFGLSRSPLGVGGLFSNSGAQRLEPHAYVGLTHQERHGGVPAQGIDHVFAELSIALELGLSEPLVGSRLMGKFRPGGRELRDIGGLVSGQR